MSDEEEKFATLDMQKIDLYSGKIKFMKVGAVESFIKLILSDLVNVLRPDFRKNTLRLQSLAVGISQPISVYCL